MQRREWWEWAFLMVAIASLWPQVLRWPGRHWDALLYGVGGLLVVMLVVRMRRFRRLIQERKQSLSEGTPPTFPWNPDA